MASKRAHKGPRARQTENRGKLLLLREQSGALSPQISRLAGQIDGLRHLAREGWLAKEMLRLQCEGAHRDVSYHELRQEVLTSLVFAEALVEKLGMKIDTRSEFADKYVLGATSGLCHELTHICRGACCRERFPLTAQDIVEGIVEFDPDYPYMIKIAPSGYCTHFDQDSMKCKIWEQRPARCRLYTCRWDRGVWKDYVKHIPADAIAASPRKPFHRSDRYISRGSRL